MVTGGLRLVLLMFAAIAYAGAGAVLATVRYDIVSEGHADVGMSGIVGLLLLFGALCAGVAAGFSGAVGFGLLVLWAGYIVMAQRIGLFRIDIGHRSVAPDPHDQPHRAN